MSAPNRKTDHGHTYRIDAFGDVEIDPTKNWETRLTEVDLRMMLLKVERAKENPSGRSIKRDF